MEPDLLALLTDWVETTKVTAKDGFGRVTASEAAVRHAARIQAGEDVIRDAAGNDIAIDGVCYLDVTAEGLKTPDHLTLSDGSVVVVRKVEHVRDEKGLHHLKVAYGRKA